MEERTKLIEALAAFIGDRSTDFPIGLTNVAEFYHDNVDTEIEISVDDAELALATELHEFLLNNSEEA